MSGAVETIAACFDVDGTVVSADPLPGGHINDTYRVTCERAGTRSRFLMQRINDRVFTNPLQVMDNVRRVCAHLAAAPGGGVGVRLVPARTGDICHHDAAGACWRMYRFIEGACVFDAVRTAEQAHMAAAAFGRFQHALSDLPGPRLFETIPGFHDTAGRYAVLDDAVHRDTHGRADVAGPDIDRAMRQRALADILPALRARGDLPERIAHNDAKIGNVLFDASTGDVLCVVDLDTVMPGLSLHDFGDMVRSMASPASEEDTDHARIAVDLHFFDAVVSGYLEALGAWLTPVERAHLVTAGQVMTLEQGVRFLTDFLTGDHYYPTQRPNHNLQRCRTQFALFESLRSREAELQQCVRRRT